MRALLALLLLAPAPSSWAAGAVTLRRSTSPRASGLAEAYGAVAGGVASLSTNPAGLSGAATPRLETAFTSGVSDDTFGFIGWGQPLKTGVLAAGLTYYDAGKVDLRFANGTTSSRTAARDMVGQLAYALPLGGGLSAGAAAKYYKFELAQEARAGGAAFDFGAQWKTPARGLSFGAAARNLGAAVKFESESDPLPAEFRGGAAWSIPIGTVAQSSVEGSADTYVAATRLQLSADGVKVRDESAFAAAGAELAVDFGPNTTVSIRTGWRFNVPSDRLNFGLGVVEGRFTLDYAMTDKRDLGQVHNVGVGVRF